MLSCKEATKIASEGLDKKLSFIQRLNLKLHLFICSTCRNYIRQITFLRRAAADLDAHIEKQTTHKLSDSAKQQIKARLKKKRP